MMRRIVEPELLDALPANDPRAIHSRRDLRLINGWMGNARHIARAIASLPKPPRRILELGTGDGTLLLKFATQLSPPVELWLLDMQPVVSAETLTRYAQLGWKVQIVPCRLEEWLQAPPGEHLDLIIANLFLHHFENAALLEVFARLSPRTQAFISCDPRRYAPALLATQFLWALGCNDVTRNDAGISVRAGFRDAELSRLWPEKSGFTLLEQPGGFAAHLFCAAR